MALISAKDYLSKKGSPSDSSPQSSGLLSAKDFLSKKQGAAFDSQQKSLMDAYPQMVQDEKNYMTPARPVRPTRLDDSNLMSFSDKMRTGKLPSFDAGNSKLLQDANASIESDYRKQLDTMQAEDNPTHFQTDTNAMAGVKARNLPVIGPVLKGLDAFATNPIVDKAADIARSFYIPGAGLANIGGLTGAAEAGVARALPSLGNSLGGRVAQKALSEGIVGAPLGAAQTLQTNPNASGTDLAEGAAFGAALGGGIGAIGKFAGTKIGDALERWKASKNPVEQQAQDVLSLPPGRGDVRYQQAMERSNLAQNEDPIFASGNVKTYEPLGLPEPNIAPPTRARVETRPNEYTKKLENLFEVANQQKFTPGKELEELESLWSQMADKHDPSLNELIDLAYPKQISKVNESSLSKARSLQQSREVAGVPGRVKSLEERYQNEINQSLAPRQKYAVTGKPDGPAQNLGALNVDNGPKLNSSPLKQEAVNTGTQDYAGNPLPFRQSAIQTDRTINRNQVVNNMRKNLNVTIDTGRLVSPKRGTLGQFKVDPAVIRTRMSEDLQVISHEVGHNFDKRYNLQDPAYQQELINLTNTVNPNHLGNYQPAKHYDEAIAEYFRTRLTDPQRAEQLAPNFTKFLESKLSPKDLKGLESSVKDIDTWISQGEYNQAKGLVDFTSGTKKEGFSFNKFYSRFVDDLDPLKLAEKALKGSVGIGKDSVYKMARLSRGISQRAELAVKRGIYENGQKVSDGLADIVKPLEDLGMKEKDFATYLAVKHAQDLKAMGKTVPFDDPQMNAVLQKWDQNPVVQKVHKQVMEYNHALLGILEEAQILTPKAIQEMKQKYPNYVPFMRYFDDDAIAGFKNGGFGAAKGFANITNPIKKMSEEGSTRTIINPIESMVKNTFLVMNAAAKNKVGLQLNELSKIQDAGAWVENVGKGGASPHEHVISVFVNGEREALKIRNPELHSAMLSLDTESSNSLLRFLGGAASLLRAGATLTPDFMVRNALRDIVGNTVNSTKYGFNPLTIFSGLFHMVNRKTGVFDQFLSSGGAMGTLMSLDRDANREALTAVFKTSLADKAMNVVTSPKEMIKMFTGITPLQKTVGVLRKGSEISELSTRLGAFNKVLKKTGSAEEAAYQARDLMDFNRAGSAIRPANKAIAFLNASIQGSDRMARAFKDNPASFLVRAGTTLVLPAASIYMWNKYKLSDDEKKLYDNIPQWQKDSFFVIGIPGTGKFARIPKPFEAGMLFATGTERVLQYMEKNDPEAFKGYASSLVQSLTPPTMITALTPMLEAITNHSFFRNAPIVPQSEQGLEKKDQYGLFTSETAKGIGGLVGKTPLQDSNMSSPRIIDNTIKGYTAGLGQYAIGGIDSVIRAANGKNEIPQPAKGITEKAPFSSFMATTSGGGQIRQDFYDKWDELSKAEASAKKNGEAYGDPQYAVMKQFKTYIDALNKQYKIIQASPTMTPQEKRAKLDDLDKRMNELAGQSLGKK